MTSERWPERSLEVALEKHVLTVFRALEKAYPSSDAAKTEKSFRDCSLRLMKLSTEDYRTVVQRLFERVGYRGPRVIAEDASGSVIHLMQVDGSGELMVALWFDKENGYFEKLRDPHAEARFDRSFVAPWLAMVEEISHARYYAYQFREHETYPPLWMVEMLGAIDKYMLWRQVFTRKCEQGTRLDHDQYWARAEILTADSATRPELAAYAKEKTPSHYYGHCRARQVIDQFERFVEKEKTDDAQKLIRFLRQSSPDIVRRILSNFGIESDD